MDDNAQTPATPAGENQENHAAAIIDAGDQEFVETPEQLEAEKFITNFKDEDYDDPDAVDQLKAAQKAVKTTIAQKNHWRNKAADLAKPKSPEAAPVTPVPPTNIQSNELVQKVAFKQDHPDLPKEAVDELFVYAKAHNMDPEKAMERPMVKSFIKTITDNADISDATPKPSGSSKVTIPTDDWKNMPRKEFLQKRDQIMRDARKKR